MGHYGDLGWRVISSIDPFCAVCICRLRRTWSFTLLHRSHECYRTGRIVFSGRHVTKNKKTRSAWVDCAERVSGFLLGCCGGGMDTL